MSAGDPDGGELRTVSGTRLANPRPPFLCPNGHPVTEDARFCTECGAPLHQPTCPNGHAAIPGNAFCVVCGAAMANTSSHAAATSQQVPGAVLAAGAVRAAPGGIQRRTAHSSTTGPSGQKEAPHHRRSRCRDRRCGSRSCGCADWIVEFRVSGKHAEGTAFRDGEDRGNKTGSYVCLALDGKPRLHHPARKEHGCAATYVGY